MITHLHLFYCACRITSHKDNLAPLFHILILAPGFISQFSNIYQTMDLLDRIRQGDEAAFGNFFDEHHANLFFFFRKKTGSDFLAEELVQLTFIKLWNNRHGLNPAVALPVQLFRIARTTLIDKLRTESVANKRMDALSEALEDTATTPSLYEEKEVMERLHAAINKLPPARRTIFRMNRLEGFTYKEIASHLNISPRTVEHQISHAVRQLLQWLF